MKTFMIIRVFSSLLSFEIYANNIFDFGFLGGHLEKKKILFNIVEIDFNFFFNFDVCIV